MGSLIEVTDATFADEVLASDVPVIVEFGAPWCRPCKAIEPALTEIAADAAGQLRLVKLDIDANLSTPSRYGVLSIPTVILFADGEPRETLVGPHGKSRYARTFAPYLLQG
jgi:thioredoxin 1